jgi:hypothetical protein
MLTDPDDSIDELTAPTGNASPATTRHLASFHPDADPTGDMARALNEPPSPVCVDCKGPATVYRDIGLGIYSCAPCEAAHRSRRNA